MAYSLFYVNSFIYSAQKSTENFRDIFVNFPWALIDFFCEMGYNNNTVGKSGLKCLKSGFVEHTAP